MINGNIEAVNVPILVKNKDFPFFKNLQFWPFSGIMEVIFWFQDMFYDKFDHNIISTSVWYPAEALLSTMSSEVGAQVATAII